MTALQGYKNGIMAFFRQIVHGEFSETYSLA
jgi:hypothetical protein